MAMTFVNIGAQGFWMRDSMLELWLRFLALHLPEPDKNDPHAGFKRGIRDQWLAASAGMFHGLVPVRLEEAAATAAGQRIVLQAIEDLMRRLKCAPALLDGDTLNLMGFAYGYYDIEKWRLIEIGEAFTALINGEITTTSEQRDFMPGCRDQRDL